MTLEEVLNQAILEYLGGVEPEEYGKSDAPLKYTKKYFDDADKRLLPEEDLEDLDSMEVKKVKK